MKLTLFIVNPASARGATLRAWNHARRKITSFGFDFDEHLTSSAGEATTITRNRIVDGVERVIAVGGDGTLGEIVNGYFDLEGKVINSAAAVGLLPSGTGSDFGRSLGLRNSPETLRRLFSTEPRLLDVARAWYRGLDGAEASRFLINVASFGLGGEVSAQVNRWRDSLPRWVGGQARFSAAALVALGRYRNVSVSLKADGDQLNLQSNLIIVANGKFAGGGMLLAPQAVLDDGLLDLVMTDGASRNDVIKELPGIRRGSYLRNKRVTARRAREISVEAECPLPIDLDGEMVGYTPARIVVLGSAVRFIG